MAENLARIFGTEEDKVNCAFYHKIGACRHGDRCSRTHNRPPFSPTILIPRMYKNPKAAAVGLQVMGQQAQLDEEKVQQDFEEFYEEVWDELSKFGPLEDLHVCDNYSDHMLGNVYAVFEDEEDAQKALQNLTGRYYAGEPLKPEYSPVTDFRASTCRQYDQNCCTRAGFCNFMHLKTIGYELRNKLFKNRASSAMRRDGSPRRRSRSRSNGRRRRERSRSRSGRRSRSRERRHRGGGKEREKSRERVDRERVDRERVDRERVDRERVDRERVDRERVDRERVDRERVDRERADREKDRGDRDRERIERDKERGGDRERDRNDRDKDRNKDNNRRDRDRERDNYPEDDDRDREMKR